MHPPSGDLCRRLDATAVSRIFGVRLNRSRPDQKSPAYAGFKSCQFIKPRQQVGPSVQFDYARPDDPATVYTQALHALQGTELPGKRNIASLGERAFAADLPNGGILIVQVGPLVVYIDAVGSEDAREALVRLALG
jgi:hypothetical protein